MARRLYILAVLACMFAACHSTAAPLNTDLVPSDAKWVIHVDYEAFSDSTLAEQIRSQRPEIAKRIHQWFEENCGIDPRHDIKSVTLFSDDYKQHSGAAVFYGNYDQAKVESMLQKKRDVETTDWEGHKFYTWTLPHGHGGLDPEAVKEHVEDSEVTDKPTDAKPEDKEKPKHDRDNRHSRHGHHADHGHGHRGHQHEVTAVLLDGKKAVMAGSVERAKEVVALINGDAPTLKVESKLLIDMPKNAIVYASAIDLKEIDQHDRPFPILEQHKRVQWYLGEHDDQVFETLTLVANRPQVAREMKTALEGLIALGKVWAGDLEKLSQLYDDTEISRRRSTVTVEWEGDIADVMAALDELKPRFQAWRDYQQQKRR